MIIMDKIDYSNFKVFKEYYVGLRKQGDNLPPLGFATPFEDNSAGKKRIETVNRWCGNGKNMKFDNVPVKGFEISKSVRRVYWGGGNVVWRIYDPRGFEVEISSANLSRIIDSVGILPGGVIDSNCVWGRLGSENILIPEGSELWSKQIDPEARTKDYNIGDMIILKNGDSVMYCGHLNILLSKASIQAYDGNGNMITEHSNYLKNEDRVTNSYVVNKFHVCLHVVNGENVFIFRKNIEVNSIAKPGELSTKQVDELIDSYNKSYRKTYINNYSDKVFFISKNTIPDYHIFMEEVDLDEIKKEYDKLNWTFSYEFYTEYEGKMFLIDRLVDPFDSKTFIKDDFKLYSQILDMKEKVLVESVKYYQKTNVRYNKSIKFYRLMLKIGDNFKCKAR